MTSIDDLAGRLALLEARECAPTEAAWEQTDIQNDVLALVPRAFALRHRILPLAREGRRLRVAVADARETEGTDHLAFLTGLEIVPHVAPAGWLNRELERWNGGEAATPAGTGAVGIVRAPATPARSPASETLDEDHTDAPIVKLVHTMIGTALQRGASDIHLEPMASRFRVRHRIDGVLLEGGDPPQRLHPAIISRIKIMAGISIAEKRIPQDGRMRLDLAGRRLELRVSSIPTAHGESMVLRILERRNLRPDLSELGFSDDYRETVRRLLTLPDGIVLVTGPTGSGKTTTLYSFLQHLNEPGRKIITVEDPVEYQLSGVNQVPVRPEIGLTFGAALRAMLRQSPNIIMVGEIRDLETASIALNASLTGHLVFSTLHTNDAPGAVSRLIDLGVKPFLVATASRAVVAQRLVRRVCPDCRKRHDPSPADVRVLGLSPEQLAVATFMRGAGCPACHGTGYRGRVGIFELLVVNEEIQNLIHGGASPSKLREKARALGLRTLREDGVRQVTAGLTTVEEVVSITSDGLP